MICNRCEQQANKRVSLDEQSTNKREALFMYKKLYFLMFNRITDAVDALKEGRNDDALQMLTDAQSEAEQIFMDGSENNE